MRKRNWMYKLSGKTMNVMAAMALMVTAVPLLLYVVLRLGQNAGWL